MIISEEDRDLVRIYPALVVGAAVKLVASDCRDWSDPGEISKTTGIARNTAIAHAELIRLVAGKLSRGALNDA